MTHAVEAATIIQTVTAFLYVALGLWVLTLTPRRRQTTLLGAFAVLFGLVFAPTDVLAIFDLAEFLSTTWLSVQLPFAVLAFAAATALAWSVPEPLEDRRLLAWAFGVGGLLASLPLVPILAAGEFRGAPVSGPVLGLALFGIYLWPVPALLLALRARPSKDPDPREVTQLAILAVAFATLFAFVRGIEIPIVAREAVAGAAPVQFLNLGPLAAWVVVAGLWGWNMVRADERTVRTHRASMLAILGLIVGGALYKAAFPAVDPLFNLMRGVMRTLGVALLAYGILRHDLAGLDEKVEFGVSKTTVAGVFIAVFFIVSEGAQVLFAGVADGNEWIGVIAAGLLVFAISPLQRMADRFAARAVPGGAHTGDERSDAKDTFRRALRVALKDREITRDEERELLVVADRLGIGPERALELREQVEDELGSGGDAE